jgi:flagellar motility protein MotE (MotC chaperone)
MFVMSDVAEAGPAAAKKKGSAVAAADAEGAKKPKPLPEVTPDGPLQAQYCQSVRDAAAEARFAYQSEKLETLAREIDERLARLGAKTAELKEWMAKREDFKNKSTAQLVSIFAAMRPESASEQLTRIEPATAASILSKLEARSASAILNDMPSDKAAGLASILAGSAQQDTASSQ